MKKILTLLMVLTASMLFINPNFSKADGTDKDKSVELSSQIIQEIKEALKTPYLRYESKDLSGEVTFYTTVDNNGRILFTGLKGINENLISNVKSKLNSLNLWTSPDYKDIIFRYRIDYKDRPVN
ncbi:MAG: hypothetical protein JSS91_10640 [Bacteroidetes bacterium]|nr:hypothetical protein [Bacteroidota bacterium]